MDELAKRRFEHKKSLVAMVRTSFESAVKRGDAAFYVRPETGWVLLELAEEALAKEGGDGSDDS